MSFLLKHSFLILLRKARLQARIQQMVAQGILCRPLPPGRTAALVAQDGAHLGVSRITVTLAYTELVADDYLTSRGRSGYFVSENAPNRPPFQPSAPTRGTVDWTRTIGAAVHTGAQPRQARRLGQITAIRSSMGRRTRRCLTAPTGGFARLRALGMRDFSALTADYYDQR